jgi:membrane-anchored glycerophosphoryl diester phosphodiesterase (GDPDase)
MPRLFSFKPSITFQGPGVPRGSRMGWQTAKRTQVWRTVNAHALIMVTATVLVLVEIVLRLSQYGVSATGFPVLILSVIVALLVLWGSFYWGELAYDYQFNVERLKGSTVWDETQGDEMPGERWRSEG